MKSLAAIIGLFLIATSLSAQTNSVEKGSGEMLVTFGNMSEKYCQHSDYSQVIYIALPGESKDSFYVRIFDPDCGGKNDLASGLWETNTLFELYGGEGCLTRRQSDSTNSLRPHYVGSLLKRAIYARESESDDHWVNLTSVYPDEGERIASYPGYVFFKVVVYGSTGDDGNTFSLFASRDKMKNTPVPGATLFQFESTYLVGDSLIVQQRNPLSKSNAKYPLPVDLAPIIGNRTYDILARPVE